MKRGTVDAVLVQWHVDEWPGILKFLIAVVLFALCFVQ